MLYLICYDIASASRRRRIANTLLDCGRRVQESAFECELPTEARLRTLLNRLRGLSDRHKDTIRAYRVCGACVSERVLIGIDIAPPRPRTLIV